MTPIQHRETKESRLGEAFLGSRIDSLHVICQIFAVFAGVDGVISTVVFVTIGLASSTQENFM